MMDLHFFLLWRGLPQPVLDRVLVRYPAYCSTTTAITHLHFTSSIPTPQVLLSLTVSSCAYFHHSHSSLVLYKSTMCHNSALDDRRKLSGLLLAFTMFVNALGTLGPDSQGFAMLKVTCSSRNVDT